MLFVFSTSKHVNIHLAQRLGWSRINMVSEAELDDVIYLDNNATTRPDPLVVQAAAECFLNHWANPSSRHVLGRRAKTVVERARADVARTVGAKPHEVFFMSGGTEACNTVIQGAINMYQQSGRSGAAHIVASSIEHDAVSLTLARLEYRGECRVSYVSCERGGCVSPQCVVDNITAETCLVAVMMANNETGVINDIAAIVSQLDQLPNRRQFWVFSDSAQAVGKMPVDVATLGVDMLTVVGHKFHGPRIAALFVSDRCRQSALSRTASHSAPLLALMCGGVQEDGVRPGTENTAHVHALGVACRLVQGRGLNEAIDHMTSARNKLELRLLQEGVIECVNLSASPRLANTSSVVVACAHSANDGDVTGAAVLARCRHVMASTGAACHENTCHVASEVLLRSGVAHEHALRTIRLSVSRDTSEQDIARAVLDLKQAHTSATCRLNNKLEQTSCK